MREHCHEYGAASERVEWIGWPGAARSGLIRPSCVGPREEKYARLSIPWCTSLYLQPSSGSLREGCSLREAVLA